jgi:hypothetical protein
VILNRREQRGRRGGRFDAELRGQKAEVSGQWSVVRGGRNYGTAGLRTTDDKPGEERVDTSGERDVPRNRLHNLAESFRLHL